MKITFIENHWLQQHLRPFNTIKRCVFFKLKWKNVAVLKIRAPVRWPHSRTRNVQLLSGIHQSRSLQFGPTFEGVKGRDGAKIRDFIHRKSFNIYMLKSIIPLHSTECATPSALFCRASLANFSLSFVYFLWLIHLDINAKTINLTNLLSFTLFDAWKVPS